MYHKTKVLGCSYFTHWSSTCSRKRMPINFYLKKKKKKKNSFQETVWSVWNMPYKSTFQLARICTIHTYCYTDSKALFYSPSTGHYQLVYWNKRIPRPLNISVVSGRLNCTVFHHLFDILYRKLYHDQVDRICLSPLSSCFLCLHPFEYECLLWLLRGRVSKKVCSRLYHWLHPEVRQALPIIDGWVTFSLKR